MAKTAAAPRAWQLASRHEISTKFISRYCFSSSTFSGDIFCWIRCCR